MTSATDVMNGKVLSHETPSSAGLSALGMIALIAAATAVGFAIRQNAGEYSPLAILLIAAAIVATVASVFSSPRTIAARGFARIDRAFAVALTLQFFSLFVLWPVGADHKFPIYLALPNHLLYLGLVAISGLLVMLGFLDLAPTRRTWFPALLIFHSLLGFWTVRSSPLPHIDVWYFQEEAPRALLGGRNPYDFRHVQFPDIYLSTHGSHQRVYGEGMVVDDTLQFGFPYPPISLYCSTLGFWLGNDTRFAQAVALTLAGLLIGYCRPGRQPKLAAALLLFTPSVWFVLGRAWTEPFVILFLALTIFCACRRLRWALPIALGLFLASKQYLFFAVPLSCLLVRDFNWRRKGSWLAWGMLLLVSAAVAAAVTLPIALRDWHAFWFSTVTVQREAPFRWDALSFLVWAGLNIDSKYTLWGAGPAFVAAVAGLAAALGRLKPSPGAFAAALGLVYLLFIAFNKQAFCNYYFFVIGCMCCAIGAYATDRPAVRHEIAPHR